MQNPTRQDIEQAAALFFARLQAAVDQPRELPAEAYDDAVSFNIEETRVRIRDLDNQLRSNAFSDQVEANVSAMLEAFGLAIGELDIHLATLARQLAAKAEREQMRYFEHQLLRPERRFEADDPLFERHYSDPGSATLDTLPAPSLSLESLIAEHVASMRDQGQGASHVNEFRRVGRWLLEEFGAETGIGSITTVAAREFRDKLRRIDATRRSAVKDGEKTLSSSLTDDRDKQIKSDTARRYWSYVKALFRRAVSEGHLASDPVASLEVPMRRDEEIRSSMASRSSSTRVRPDRLLRVGGLHSALPCRGRRGHCGCHRHRRGAGRLCRRVVLQLFAGHPAFGRRVSRRHRDGHFLQRNWRHNRSGLGHAARPGRQGVRRT